MLGYFPGAISRIVAKMSSGKWRRIELQYTYSPAHAGVILNGCYREQEKIDQLLSHGDLLSLGETIGVQKLRQPVVHKRRRYVQPTDVEYLNKWGEKLGSCEFEHRDGLLRRDVDDAPTADTAEALLGDCSVWPVFIWNGEHWFIRESFSLFPLYAYLQAKIEGRLIEPVDSFAPDAEATAELVAAVEDWT
jgi:hypothetical protein